MNLQNLLVLITSNEPEAVIGAVSAADDLLVGSQVFRANYFRKQQKHQWSFDQRKILEFIAINSNRIVKCTDSVCCLPGTLLSFSGTDVLMTTVGAETGAVDDGDNGFVGYFLDKKDGFIIQISFEI